MTPLSAFIPQRLNGSLSRGGWVCTGQLIADTDALERGRNVQVLARSTAGGWRDPQYRAFFEGHVIDPPDQLRFDKFGSTATVQIGTADALLHGYLQDIGFSENGSPSNEHQITGLTFAKMVEHVLRRHCNAIYDATRTPDGVVTSLTFDSGSVAVAMRNVRKSNSLWQRVQEIGGGERAGEFWISYFRRDNSFHYQPHSAFQTGPPASKGTLRAGHIKGMPQVKINSDRIAQVQLVTFKGGTTTYNSEYPTSVIDEGTIHQLTSGVWADSQAKSDTLAERLYKWLTRPYTLIIKVDAGLTLYGDDGNGLDLADAVTVVYDGPADDGGNGVHLNINNKFYVYEVDVTFDAAGHAATAQLTLEIDNA